MAWRKCVSAMRELAAAQVPAGPSRCCSGIQRVAAQGLAPVQRRAARGVAILFQMQAGEEKFVGAGDLFGRRRFGGGRRDFAATAAWADRQ